MFETDDTSQTKETIPILILGSYHKLCYDKLVIFKNELQKCGYLNTSLVSELPTPKEIEYLEFANNELFIYKKSTYYISKNKILLFVFFKDCPYGSVISEMIVSVLRFGQFKCSTFFFEEGLNFDSVPKGFLSEYDLHQSIFEDLEDLITKSKRHSWNHIIDGCEKYKPVPSIIHLK